MDDILLRILSQAAEMSPAIGVLLWVAYRMDMRAQECFARLIEHLDRDH